MSVPRVLIDCNVMLDVVLHRAPHFADSAKIWDANHTGQIEGYLAATVLTNVAYIVLQHEKKGTQPDKAKEAARKAVRECLDAFQVVPMSWRELDDAYRLGGSDFEDDVLISCAQSAGLEAIVSRDPKGFAASTVSMIKPADFETWLASRLMSKQRY